MDSVFILQHLHLHPGGEDDVKLIGAYRSRDSVLAAVNRLKSQPGFRDLPDVVTPGDDNQMEGFYVDELRLDLDYWSEGYVTS